MLVKEQNSSPIAPGTMGYGLVEVAAADGAPADALAAAVL